MSSNNVVFFILLAVLAGMAVPFQASLNSKLADSLGNPVPAAVIALGLGCLTVFVFMLVSGIPLSSFATLKTTPVGYMIGGLFGGFFVGSMVYTVPRIGVALSLALTVGGQMIVAIVIDHFGWMGMQQKDLNLWRVAGAVLITVGVVLIKRF
jgi:transporter family-2 protein